jgi:predicted Zn-dependent peptidase
VFLTGGLPAEELRAVAERGFGGWVTSASSAPVAPAPHDTVRSVPRLALVPRPTAQQSELRIGRLATPRRTPDYFPLVVMNAVLGGQFVSRINLKLREEKAFTYGARTAFDWRRGVAPLALYTSVHTASTAEAVADALREFDALRGARPVTASELELAKASLTRGYPQNFQTVSQVAGAVGQLALYELPHNYFTNFGPSVHAVTAAEVTRVARSYLDPATLTVLVVGDESVAASLSTLGLPPLETLAV